MLVICVKAVWANFIHLKDRKKHFKLELNMNNLFTGLARPLEDIQGYYSISSDWINSSEEMKFKLNFWKGWWGSQCNIVLCNLGLFERGIKFLSISSKSTAQLWVMVLFAWWLCRSALFIHLFFRTGWQRAKPLGWPETENLHTVCSPSIFHQETGPRCPFCVQF